MSKKLIFIEQNSSSSLIEAITQYVIKITTIKLSKIVINPEGLKRSLETGMFNTVVIITHSDILKVYCNYILSDVALPIEEASFFHIEDTITYRVTEAGLDIPERNRTYTVAEFIHNFKEILDNSLSIAFKNSKSIFIKPVGDTNKYLSTTDIIYLQGSTYYTLIRTKTGDCYKVHRSQKSMLSDLPPYFLKIHQSYTVNTKNVKYWSKEKVFLTNGETLPIGFSLAPRVTDFMGRNSRTLKIT